MCYTGELFADIQSFSNMASSTKILAALITLSALVAMGLSVYLAWSAWGAGEVAGCTADGAFDCDTVLSSDWSRWLGVPVAALGAIVYLAIIVATWPAARAPRRFAMSTLAALSILAFGSALWFVGLQLFELQSFCAYCLVVHICAFMIATATLALFLTANPHNQLTDPTAVVNSSIAGVPSLVASRRDSTSSLSSISIVFMGLAGVTVLIAGQLIAPSGNSTALQEIELKPVARNESAAPNTGDGDVPDFMQNAPTAAESIDSSQTAPGRLLNFAALSRPLVVDQTPLIGAPNAQHIIVEMLDYTCSHCRKLHPRLIAARKRYGDDLAIALYHAPLNKECNDHLPRGRKGRRDACEYARLALAVWELAPGQFAEYHNWLMVGRAVPSIGQARQRAMGLVGDQVLLDKTLREKNTKRLRKQCDSWNAVADRLPVLLFPESALLGGGKSNEELFTAIEQKLGLEPIALQDK